MARSRLPAQEERDRHNIGRMYLKGMIQADIAKELQVSQSTISREIKMLVEEWRVERAYDINEAKQRELAKVDALEIEYWEAWKRSQEDAVTRTEGKTSQGFVDTTRTEGQAGDPRFLDGVLKCIQKRCDILGVDAPKKIAGTGEGGEFIITVRYEDRKRAINVNN